MPYPKRRINKDQRSHPTSEHFGQHPHGKRHQPHPKGHQNHDPIPKPHTPGTLHPRIITEARMPNHPPNPPQAAKQSEGAGMVTANPTQSRQAKRRRRDGDRQPDPKPPSEAKARGMVTDRPTQPRSRAKRRRKGVRVAKPPPAASEAQPHKMTKPTPGLRSSAGKGRPSGE
jgi:hypothetical protein